MLSARALFAFLTSFAISVYGAYLGELTTDNFGTAIASGDTLVLHDTPHCAHCKTLQPIWEQLVKEAEKEFPEVNLGRVNCISHGDLCDENGIAVFPQMVLYKDGKEVSVYNGRQTLQDIKEYISQCSASKASVVPPSSCGLKPSDFDSAIAKGYSLILHGSRYSSYTNALRPTWLDLIEESKSEFPDVYIGEVDCQRYGDICAKNGVFGYPTILLFKDGQVIERYKGDRSLNNFREFLEQHVPKSVKEQQGQVQNIPQEPLAGSPAS